jgi:hypothetical protein
MRRITLSNHIARTRLPESVVASYYGELRGVAEITLSHQRNSEGYKEPVLDQGLRIIHKISFQRTLETILKYY